MLKLGFHASFQISEPQMSRRPICKSPRSKEVAVHLQARTEETIEGSPALPSSEGGSSNITGAGRRARG